MILGVSCIQPGLVVLLLFQSLGTPRTKSALDQLGLIRTRVGHPVSISHLVRIEVISSCFGGSCEFAIRGLFSFVIFFVLCIFFFLLFVIIVILSSVLVFILVVELLLIITVFIIFLILFYFNLQAIIHIVDGFAAFFLIK